MTGRRPPTFVHVLLFLLAAALGAAWAEGDGAVYVGELPSGVPLYVEVEIGVDASATVRVRPAARVDGPEGRTLEAEGIPVWSSRNLDVAATSRPSTDSGHELHLSASLQESSRALDPFGAATLSLRGATIELNAIGSVYTSRAGLADGSFEVARVAPFFYAAPWSALDLAGATRGGVAESIDTGLEQRRELPGSIAGFWIERRVVRVMSLDAELVSVLFEGDAYTGGAHPNQWRSSATWLHEDGAWRRVDLCDALEHFGLPCDRSRIAALVVAELGDQEAAWVVQGEVSEDTPWLLDTFTLVADGLRFDFSPYEVGPYAQGPFTVVVPFRSVTERTRSE